MITAGITFITITPDSAAEGDYDDAGWHIEKQPVSVSALWDILVEAEHLGIHIGSDSGDCPRWWESDFTVDDYGTGTQIAYSLHIDGITDATRRRIHRYLNGVPVLGRCAA